MLGYYDFGSDGYVSDIRHNKGGYPTSLPSGAEVLARYDYPQKDVVHLQPSAWAYKEDLHTGRVVLEGSHPEEVADGERRDLTAAMILYALDGIGTTQLKGFLQNGKSRVMDCVSEDGNPSHARIGDKQCHHFAVYLPSDTEKLSISLDSEASSSFSVFVNPDTFAYPEDALYGKSVDDGNTTLELTDLPAGIWYVCVQCNDSVTAFGTSSAHSYNDPTGVLNGILYQLTVSWKEKGSHDIDSSIRAMQHSDLESKSSKLKAEEAYYSLGGVKNSAPTSNTIYIQNVRKRIATK